MKKVYQYCLFMLLVFHCVPAMAQWEGAEMYVLTNDTLYDKLLPHSIRVDGYNNLHFTYLKTRPDTGFDMYYDKRLYDGTWNGATLINEVTEPVAEADFGVYGQDSLYFVYTVITDNGPQLKLTQLDGPFKTTFDIGDLEDPEYSPVCQVDKNGLIHFLYIAPYTSDFGTSNKIHYVNNEVSDFYPIALNPVNIPEIIENCKPDLAIGSQGDAHFAFRSGNNGNVIQYVFNSELNIQNWSYYTVNAAPDAPILPKIAIGKDDQVHLAVSGTDGINNTIYTQYFKKISSVPVTWEPLQNIVGSGSGLLSSLHTDSLGVPCAGISELENNQPNGNVLAAVNDNGEWEAQQLMDSNNIFEPQVVYDNIGQGYMVGRRQTSDTNSSEIILWGKPTTEPTVPAIGTSIQLAFTDTYIQAYPNPAKEGINVILPFSNGIIEYEILDIFGRLIDKSSRFMDQKILHFNLNDSYNSGIHLIRIKSGNKSYLAKFIVE